LCGYFEGLDFEELLFLVCVIEKVDEVLVADQAVDAIVAHVEVFPKCLRVYSRSSLQCLNLK
jgi:hypothetical protein